MSASEKLRTLTHDMGYGGVEETRDGSLRLVRSLPQIWELVIWAEKFSNFGDYHAWTNAEHPRLAPELDTILAALDEALS